MWLSLHVKMVVIACFYCNNLAFNGYNSMSGLVLKYRMICIELALAMGVKICLW